MGGTFEELYVKFHIKILLGTIQVLYQQKSVFFDL